MENKQKSMLIALLLLAIVPELSFSQDNYSSFNASNIARQRLMISPDNILQPDNLVGAHPVTQNCNAEFQIDFVTNYIWRDEIYDYPAIQPSVDYSFGESGFSMNIWSSIEADYETNNIEVVPSLSYGLDIKKLSFSSGLIFYTAPEDKPDTNSNSVEVMLASGLSTLFNPTLEFYRDLEGGDIYLSFNIEQAIISQEQFSFNINGHVGYGKEVTDVHVGLSLPFEFNNTTLGFMSKVIYFPEADSNNDEAPKEDFLFLGGITLILK